MGSRRAGAVQLDEVNRMITIREKDYNDIMMGKTGNGVADMIPSVLKEKMVIGHEVYVTDESDRIIAQVVCTER